MTGNWENHFDQVTKIDESTRFETYKAFKSGDWYFVKQATSETDEWSRKSIDKEYEVYSNVFIPKYMETSVELYRNSKVLCTDWIENHNWIYQNFSQQSYVHKLIDDLVNLIRKMRQHEPIKIETRWPNKSEFYYRMNAEVNFNKGAFKELFPVLNQAKEKAKTITDNQNIDECLVHGDLFYPNIMFNKNGLVKSLIDWEIAGEFDQMYDVAFLESNIIEIIASTTEKINRRDILKQFRVNLGIDETQVERIELYKMWPYYVNLAAVQKRDSIPKYSPFRTKSDAMDVLYDLFRKNLSESVINVDFDKPNEIL